SISRIFVYYNIRVDWKGQKNRVPSISES
ncbi:uncharacterized protein METZ01_LOCUS399046, partial [marine metagenome]